MKTSKSQNPKPKPDYGDFNVDAFVEHITNIRSPGTARKYMQGVVDFMTYLDSKKVTTLEKLPANILDTYTDSLTSRGLAAATINLYMSGVKRYLVWMKKQGISIIFHDPELPRIRHQIREILSPEVLQRFIDCAHIELQQPYRAAVQMLPFCGLRADELCNLTLGNLYQQSVTLSSGKEKQSYYFRVKGKGGDEKAVPILDEGVVVLLDYLTGWRKTKNGPWLFPMITAKDKTKSKPINARGLRAACDRMVPVIGQDFSPHTMRRTYAVTLHRRGVEATMIAKIMGHKSINTLMNHYLNTDTDDILKAFQGRDK